MTAWTKFTSEQLRAALLVDRNMVAAAGAGSGKTAVMAARYVACLLDRLDGRFLTPEQVIAITFTREAAGNLRVRIDATVRAAIASGTFPQRKGEDGVDRQAALDDLQLAHLRAALLTLPTAPICTFDSFCLDLVSAHAATLGRDPDLLPADDLSWRQCGHDTWAIVRHEFARARAAEYAGLVEAYGEHAVKFQVMRLAGNAAALAGGKVAFDADDPVARILELRARQLLDAAAALRDAQKLATGKTRDAIKDLPVTPPKDAPALIDWLRRLDDLSAVGPAKPAIIALQEALNHPCPRGKPPRRQSLRCLTAWNAEEEQRCQNRARLFAAMAMRFNVVERQEAEKRARAGFSRIESEALAFITRESGRAWLRQSFRHALCDESQDFNGLQDSFIEALRAEGVKIFSVGDHRQSIYAFRHAAPELFKRREKAEAREGATARLAENFRSHPDLVEQVKEIFSQPALSRYFDPAHIRPGRQASDFKRSAGLSLWRVDHGLEKKNKPCPAGSEAQAGQIARLIAQNCANGLAFADHAILLRGRARMRLFAAALERAGIAYDADFSEGLYDSQECHDVEALLRLCLCPDDRFALAVAAGGPWGTLDPHDKRDLVRCMAGDLSRDEFMSRTALPTVLPELRRRCAGEGAASAIRWLASRPELTRRYGTLPLARRRVANLALLADEESTAGMALDAAAVIERWHERRRLNVDEHEASGAALGNRGVRLMTIHGAKGLEWPVVFIPDCDRSLNLRDANAPVLALRADGGDEQLTVACASVEDDVRGLRHQVIQDHLIARNQEEEARLFYVACTRAIEQLHLFTSVQEHNEAAEHGDAACYADWLQGSGHAWQEVAAQAKSGAVMAAGSSVTVGAPAAEKTVVPEPLPDLVRALPTERGAMRALTSLLDHVLDDYASVEAGGKDLGIALHQALCRHGCGMTVEQAHATLAPFRAALAPERFSRLVNSLCDRALVPDFWNATQLREQPVVHELVAGDPSRIVSGQVDLLLRDAAGGWRLYDYKSGAAAAHPASAAQVQCYAEMARPYLDGPLIEGWLIDLEQGARIAVPVDEKSTKTAWKTLAGRW